MIFFDFLCQKPESVGLSEIALESFPDSDNFNYLFQKSCAKEIPRPTITLEILQEKVPPKLIEVLRAYILTCVN